MCVCVCECASPNNVIKFNYSHVRLALCFVFCCAHFASRDATKCQKAESTGGKGIGNANVESKMEMQVQGEGETGRGRW